MPSLPAKIYNFLVKLGKSRITESDYKNIIYKTLTLSSEDRMTYLRSTFPMLDSEQQTMSLTLAVRSKRIYKSCKWLASKSFKLTYPLIYFIVESIEQGNLYSPTLYSYKLQFESFNFKKYISSEIFKILCIRVLMNSVQVTGAFSNDDPVCVLMYTIIDELVDNGLLTWLAIVSESDSILRTVEFQVEKEVFMEWIVDIFDCAYRESNFKLTKLKEVNNRTLYGSGGLFENEFGRFRSIAMKMKQNEILPSITIIQYHKNKFKNKKLSQRNPVLKKLNKIKSKPGVTSIDFKPLDEDGQEEFDDGYRVDPDVLDFCSFDEEATLDKYAYTESFFLHFLNLTGVRGGAWNMFVGCQFFKKEIWEAKGYKKLFKREVRNLTPFNAFSLQNNFIFYIGTDNFKGEIEGYKEVSWEQSVRYGISGKFGNNFIEIKGKKYTKSDVFNEPPLVSQITTLDSYFVRLSQESLNQNIEEIENFVEIVKDIFTLPPQAAREQKELKKLIEDRRLKIEEKEKENEKGKNKQNKKKGKKEKNDDIQEEGKSETDKSGDVINIEDEKDDDSKFFKKLSSVFNNFKTLTEKGLKLKTDNLLNEIKQEQTLYTFKKVFTALTDVRFKAEFETFFPGMWEPFINNELSMTEGSITDRIDLAKFRINRMPIMMRTKYRKLLLIVTFILAGVTRTNRMDPVSMRFGYLIDNMFRVNLETDINEEFIGSDLMPEEILELPYNFDFI